MRLLNVVDQTFREFSVKDVPPYIATSHRWGHGETTYQNVKERRHVDAAGYKKVERFCAIAREQRKSQTPSWIWIDTCCINKESSAELNEAINSMFTWYRHSSYCIAYLADVRPFSAGLAAVMDDFKRSEWFTRGWTLQELLAPSCVIFVTRNGEVIGHKCSSEARQRTCPGCAERNNRNLNTQIAEITGIPEVVLWNYEASKSLRPKAKWGWTANRETTRPEDSAYCLLGIFDVYMPLIYGEGADNASARLRQEITKRNKQKKPGQRAGPHKPWNLFPREGAVFSDESIFVATKPNTQPVVKPPRRQWPPHHKWPFNVLDTDSSDPDSDAEDIFRPEASTRINSAPQGRPRRTNTSSSGPNSPGPRRIQTHPPSLATHLPSGRAGDPGNYKRAHDRAVAAGVTASQIACAGAYLPGLDVKALSCLTPAQIAAAQEFLPLWDLEELSRSSPQQIALATHMARMARSTR